MSDKINPKHLGESIKDLLRIKFTTYAVDGDHDNWVLKIEDEDGDKAVFYTGYTGSGPAAKDRSECLCSRLNGVIGDAVEEHIEDLTESFIKESES